MILLCGVGLEVGRRTANVAVEITEQAFGGGAQAVYARGGHVPAFGRIKRDRLGHNDDRNNQDRA